MARILLIDDDVRLGGLLREFFARFELELEHAAHPREGLQALGARAPDLVILDLMLPDQDGFDVCREIRQRSNVPIIMLTARGDVMDRIVGLEIGADDYLAKPFEPRELVARVKTVLRRAAGGEAGAGVLHFAGLSIDAAARTARTARTGARELDLTTMEFELLALLATNARRTLSRDDILNHLRGIDTAVFSRSVDILVSRLRHKLGDDSRQPRYIKTMWGRGYRFIAQPEPES